MFCTGQRRKESDMTSRRLAALGVVAAVIGLAAGGCGRNVPPPMHEEAQLIVTALGTSDEVEAAFKKGEGSDLAAAFSAKCLSKGVSKEDAAALQPKAKVRRGRVAEDRFCLALGVGCRLPARRSSLGFVCPDQGAGQLAYDACRAVLDDLFGRATKAAGPRPKRLFVYCQAPEKQTDMDAFFAGLKAPVDALCRKAGWTGGSGDEPPVKAPGILQNRAAVVEFDEGWDAAAAETVKLVREKLAAVGWKVEQP